MHETRFFDFDLGANKTNVEKSLNDYATRNGDGGVGLPKSIEWKNKKFDSYEKAYDYIESLSAKGWYEQMAVQYLDKDSVKKTSKRIELEKRVGELQKEYHDRKFKFHFKDIKSEYIGCKECGSKISLKHLRTNGCPVCGNDMRPQTVLNRIDKSKEKLEQTKKKLQDEILKQKSKMKYKWLVKIEFHC